MYDKGYKQKAVVYCRVSTDEQAESGLGLNDQERRCRAYCVAKGIDIVEIIRDEGDSAKDLERPGVKLAFSLLERGLADILVFLKLDRFTRSMLDMLGIIKKAENERWSLASVEESLDTSTVQGRMFVKILMVFAEGERENVQERTKKALEQKKAQGEKTGGLRPFGFDVHEKDRNGRKVKSLEKNKHEQKMIKLIVELREHGFTLQAIAKELRRRKIKNASGNTAWNLMSITRICQRNGLVTERKIRRDKGKKRGKRMAIRQDME